MFSIPVEYYNIIYYNVVLIFVIFFFVYTTDIRSQNSLNISILNVLYLVLLFFVFFYYGFRDPFGDPKILGDTSQYSKVFLSISTSDLSRDYGFYKYVLFAQEFFSLRQFHFFNCVLYIAPLFFAFRNINKKYQAIFFIYYLTTMSFLAYGINGVRNGIGTSFFICGFFCSNKFKRLFFYLLSVSFHKSLLLPVIAYYMIINIRKTNWYLYLWIGCFLISVFFGGVISNFFSTIDISGDGRLNAESFVGQYDGRQLRVGLRFDFILYSLVPILWGWFVLKRKKYYDVIYLNLYHLYVFTNSFWVLINRVAYSNRYAYLSWFLYSIVLLYPLIKKNMFKNQLALIGYIVLFQYIFTYILFLR